MSLKLRASCDACHKVKVKCTDGIDDCVRCQSMKKECQYSPALLRLFQKRRLKFSNASEFTSSSRISPVVTQINLALLERTTSFLNRSFEPFLDDNLDLHYPASLNEELTDRHWIFWKARKNFTDLFSLSEPHSIRRDDEGFSAIFSTVSTASIPSSDDQNSDYRDFLNSFIFLDLPQFNSNNQCSSCVGSFGDLSHHLVSFESHSETERTQKELLKNHEKFCSCLSNLLLAIQNVHKNSAVTIDVVFKINRKAIASCWSVIECSCISKLILLIIFCELLELVLNSYQMALETFCGSGAKEFLMTVSIPQPRPVEITLGGFDIDKDDQRFFLQQLIIRGIRKIDDDLLPAFRFFLGLKTQNLTEVLISHLSCKSKAIMGGKH